MKIINWLRRLLPFTKPVTHDRGKIKIVSDGQYFGTQVLNEDGKQIPYVKEIEIFPIKNFNELVTARLTVINVELDIYANIEDIKERPLIDDTTNDA